MFHVKTNICIIDIKFENYFSIKMIYNLRNKNWMRINSKRIYIIYIKKRINKKSDK